jgi:hypothetical protein
MMSILESCPGHVHVMRDEHVLAFYVQCGHFCLSTVVGPRCCKCNTLPPGQPLCPICQVDGSV